jgi:hypothetical protein
MPRLSDTTYQLLVYRGPIEVVRMDSGSYWSGFRYEDGHIIPNHRTVWYKREFDVPTYYLVGIYDQGETVTDYLHYDSLLLRDRYERNGVPATSQAIGVHGNRLFLADGSLVYFSNDPNVDTVGALFTMLPVPLSLDDGDRVTGLYPVNDGVMTGVKNRGKYNLYDNGQGGYRGIELAAHYGMVAPLSHFAAPEGDWILSEDGVRLDSENPYKERSSVGNLMSWQIKSFTKQPITTLQHAVAAYWRNTYLLSIPSLDTTWACFKISMDNGQYRYSWATWDLVFSGAAYYSVRAENQLTPSDSLYFTMPGGSSLYRIGGNDDNGVNIVATWESGPLGPMDGGMYEPMQAALWVESDDTVTGAVKIRFYDDDYNADSSRWGTIDTGKTVTLPSLRDRRYHLFDVAPGVRGNDALFWTVDLRVEGIEAATIIEGLKIDVVHRGPAQRR